MNSAPCKPQSEQPDAVRAWLDRIDAILDSDCSTTERLLLMSILAVCAKGIAASPATLAKRIGKSPRQVRRLLRSLESRDTVVKRRSERELEYRLVPGSLAKSPPASSNENSSPNPDQERRLARFDGVLWCLRINNPPGLLDDAIKAGRTIDEIEAAITWALAHRRELGDVGFAVRVKLTHGTPREPVEASWKRIPTNLRFKRRVRR